MKKSKYFFIYNSPYSTSIKEMSLEEAKSEYLESDEDDETTYAIIEHPADEPISFSFDLDIDSTHGKIIALKGGDEEPIDIEDNRVYIKTKG